MDKKKFSSWSTASRSIKHRLLSISANGKHETPTSQNDESPRSSSSTSPPRKRERDETTATTVKTSDIPKDPSMNKSIRKDEMKDISSSLETEKRGVDGDYDHDEEGVALKLQEDVHDDLQKPTKNDCERGEEDTRLKHIIFDDPISSKTSMASATAAGNDHKDDDDDDDQERLTVHDNDDEQSIVTNLKHPNGTKVIQDERKPYYDVGDVVYANWEQTDGPYWMRGVVEAYQTLDENNNSNIESRNYTILFDDDDLVHDIHETFVKPYEDYLWYETHTLDEVVGVEQRSLSQGNDKYLIKHGWYDVTLSSTGAVKRCYSICQALRLLDAAIVEANGIVDSLDQGLLYLPDEWEVIDSNRNEGRGRTPDVSEGESSRAVPTPPVEGDALDRLASQNKSTKETKDETKIAASTNQNSNESNSNADAAQNNEGAAEHRWDDLIQRYDTSPLITFSKSQVGLFAVHIQEKFSNRVDMNDFVPEVLVLAFLTSKWDSTVVGGHLSQTVSGSIWMDAYNDAPACVKEYMDAAYPGWPTKESKGLKLIGYSRHKRFQRLRKLMFDERPSATKKKKQSLAVQKTRWDDLIASGDTTRISNYSEAETKAFGAYIRRRYSDLVELDEMDSEVLVMAFLLSKWDPTFHGGITSTLRYGSMWVDAYEVAPSCVKNYMKSKCPDWKTKGRAGRRLLGKTKHARFQRLRKILHDARQKRPKQADLQQKEDKGNQQQREDQQENGQEKRRRRSSSQLSTQQRDSGMKHKRTRRMAADTRFDRNEDIEMKVARDTSTEANQPPLLNTTLRRLERAQSNSCPSVLQWHEKFVRRSQSFEREVKQNWTAFCIELRRDWMILTSQMGGESSVDRRNDYWNRFCDKQELLWQSWLNGEKERVFSHCCRISQSATRELLLCYESHQVERGDDRVEATQEAPTIHKVYVEQLRRFLSRREDRICHFLDQCKQLVLDFYMQDRQVQLVDWYCGLWETLEEICDEFRGSESHILQIHVEKCQRVLASSE